MPITQTVDIRFPGTVKGIYIHIKLNKSELSRRKHVFKKAIKQLLANVVQKLLYYKSVKCNDRLLRSEKM